MKVQLLAIVSALLLFAAACTQTSLDPSASNSLSLGSARIASISNTTATSGTCVKGGNEVAITADKLPATVLAYLTSNFAGYTFVSAEQGTNKGGVTYYEVKFTVAGKTRELHFDMNGVVVTGGKGGNGGGNGNGNTEVVITKDQLPAAALTYLTTNYAGYTFVQAEKVTDSKGVVSYEIQFTLNGKTTELHFDAAGAVKK